jgi:hypothetical protein
MTWSRLARAGLALWLAATTAVAGATAVLHDSPLPLPAPPPEQPTGAAHLTHALAVECPCSGRILAYLEERGAVPGVAEEVLLVGGDPALVERLRARGFAVSVLDEAELAQRGIVGVPSLVVWRPDGTAAYRGAYAPRPQMDPIDLDLLAEVREGTAPEPMPIFGCAVSRGLQLRLDPLRIKYSLWR